MKIQSIAVSSILILLVGLLLFYMYRAEKKNILISNQNKKLDLSQKKFENLFNLQNNIIVVTDGKKLKMANDAMYKFFGVDHLELFTKNHDDISDRFIESETYFNFKEVPETQTWIEAMEPLFGDKRIVVIKDTNNETHAFNVSISKFDDVDYIVLLTDISGTMAEKMNLSKKIVRDKLTGALNREFFDSNIEMIIKHELKSKKLGVTIADIDFFKKVNDTYGHNTGDIILKELTSLIKATIREDDYFIRWGGEEFIILSKVTSKEALLRALEHVRQRIEVSKFTDVNKLTCSFGTTVYIDGEDINKTIKRADEALYLSKESGKNKVTIL